MAVCIDLSGKVILVTGAAKGIGRESALLLAEAGARVAINYATSADAADQLATQIGTDRAMTWRADVAKPDEVRGMINGVVDHFGRLDVVVNNAATFRLNRFDSGDYAAWVDGWRRTLDVNLIGAANVAFLAMEQMRKQGGGKIINVASRAAFRGETEFADYGASKAAMVNLTRSIARACSAEKIVATCVAPGFVDTEMAASELAAHGDEIVAQIPAGRVGTVRDVAGVILFLASPFADYLAGVTIDVNGGSYFH